MSLDPFTPLALLWSLPTATNISIGLSNRLKNLSLVWLANVYYKDLSFRGFRIGIVLQKL